MALDSHANPVISHAVAKVYSRIDGGAKVSIKSSFMGIGFSLCIQQK